MPTPRRRSRAQTNAQKAIMAMPEGTQFYDTRHGNGEEPQIVYEVQGAPVIHNWIYRQVSRLYPSGEVAGSWTMNQHSWYPAYRYSIRRWGRDGELIAFQPDERRW